MPSQEFVDAVLTVVDRIPAGRVMTYGDIGIAIGQEAPRAVGRVLALYGHTVAWWRVVPATGLPPQGHAREALPHYRKEGTPLRLAASSRDRSRRRPDARDDRIDPDDYRIALSSARLPYTHEIYAGVPL